MFGGLSAACLTLKWEMGDIGHYALAVRRLERIVNALESIGVNTEE